MHLFKVLIVLEECICLITTAFLDCSTNTSFANDVALFGHDTAGISDYIKKIFGSQVYKFYVNEREWYLDRMDSC